MRALIPNALTLLRTVLAPLGAWALWTSYDWSMNHNVPESLGDPALAASGLALFAVIAFVISAVSDWLDGFLARRWSAQSSFGALLDPIADKLLVGGYLLVYTLILGHPVYILVPVAAIILRDIVMTGLRLTSGQSGDAALPVSPLAKIKTALEMILIGVPFIAVWLGWLEGGLFLMLWMGALWITAALSLLTAIQYFRKR